MEILQIDNYKIEYILERKKIKRCYISIKDGAVFVRVPKRVSQKQIDEMLAKRSKWIIENVEKQKQKVTHTHEYMDGEIFRVLGENVPLKIEYSEIKNAILNFDKNEMQVIIPNIYKENSQKIVENLIEKFYDELAEKEVAKAMQKMTKIVGIEPNKYRVKDIKTAWGTCSNHKNITINKQLIKYSREAIEYVCLHEICHIKHMNHSKDFWNMVQKYMPNYKIIKKELKNG